MNQEQPIIRKHNKFCPQCNVMVEAGELFNYEHDVERIDELSVKGIVVSLSRCLKCNTPFLTRDSYTFVEDFSWYDSQEQLYPAVNTISKDAPEIILAPLIEAYKCYKVQAYEACVIMCRKGIEAICADKGEGSGTLERRLRNLRDKGILETTFYNWSNELRVLGNMGAHSHDEKISDIDAKDSLDFLEALITYLYHLIDRYSKLQSRNAKKR